MRRADTDIGSPPLARPSKTPKKIPLWWWHLDAWLSGGKKGPRPAGAPRVTPLSFRLWRRWRLARAAGPGSAQWVAYLAAEAAKPKRRAKLHPHRAAIVKHARWRAQPKISAVTHYTEDERRDDWLVAKNPIEKPVWTDCSGFGTECSFAADVPDPNGLGYAYLGFTGTLLANAQKHGKVLTDVSKALPGDGIVIGPGTGWHEVVVVEAGADPLVATHGGEGVQIQRLSVDPREPKRVCQVLPA